MKDLRLILVGCAIGTVCSTTTAWLVTSRPVEAQAQGPFTECVLARQETVDTNNSGEITRPGANRRINIPVGWEPIGGGGITEPDMGDPTSTLVLCRR
jgi:hypothetical protein